MARLPLVVLALTLGTSAGGCAASRSLARVIGDPGDAANDPWHEALRFVPAHADSIAGLDLARYDEKAHATLPYGREPPSLWAHCKGRRGAARVLVQWRGGRFGGHVILGERVGSEAHVRCLHESNEITVKKGAAGALLFIGSDELPMAYAPSPDELVELYAGEPEPSSEEWLEQYRYRGAAAPADALDLLENVDADDVAWSVARYTAQSGGASLRGRVLWHASAFRGAGPLDCRETYGFGTSELAALAVTRVERALALLDAWPENEPEDRRALGPSAIFLAAPDDHATRLLDVDRVRASARGSALVIAGELDRSQCGRLDDVAALALDPAIELDDAALDEQLREGLYPHFAPRGGIEYQ
jgi:hypothetical protein